MHGAWRTKTQKVCLWCVCVPSSPPPLPPSGCVCVCVCRVSVYESVCVCMTTILCAYKGVCIKCACVRESVGLCARTSTEASRDLNVGGSIPLIVLFDY